MWCVDGEKRGGEIPAGQRDWTGFHLPQKRGAPFSESYSKGRAARAAQEALESDPPFDEEDKRRYGYSRDHRPDCVQVVIALIVPVVAITVRRLHDSGRTGWWALLLPPHSMQEMFVQTDTW